MKGCRPVGGFTLIELVLMIGVLGIVSVAAVTFFSNLGNVKSEAAARKLVSDLAYARHLATTRNTSHGVSFDTASNAYTVYVYDSGTGAETPVTDPLRRVPMVIDLDSFPGLSGSTIGNPLFGVTTNVRFSPGQGIPEDGNGTVLAAPGSVEVSEYGGVLRSVVVQPGTGEVSIQ